MNVFSTCRDCGDLLQTTDGDTVHPTCTPRPTKLEWLTERWLSAVENELAYDERELIAQIAELENQPPRLLDSALYYATNYGWPVFPLKPLSKVPATRNGFKDATTDTAQIRDWWERIPDANIGLPTGLAFDVIDIDPPAGHQSLLELEDDLPDIHGRVMTASGGYHLYIKPTGDGNRAGIMPGIDYRGAGGYVVAPPSTLGPRPRHWAWTVKPSPTIAGAK